MSSKWEWHWELSSSCWLSHLCFLQDIASRFHKCFLLYYSNIILKDSTRGKLPTCIFRKKCFPGVKKSMVFAWLVFVSHSCSPGFKNQKDKKIICALWLILSSQHNHQDWVKVQYTSIFPNQSYMTQHHFGYLSLSTFQGTLMVFSVPNYCSRSYRAYSNCRVPLKVL